MKGEHHVLVPPDQKRRWSHRLPPRARVFGGGCALALAFAPVGARAQPGQAPPPTPSAADRLNAPGAEQALLARAVGTFDVVATLYPPGGGAPVVTRGLVARRVMVGPFLQETMQPDAGSSTPPFTRLDYLYYSRVEGRWQYVSMDTRLPVGIMPATSYGPSADGAIRLTFAPLAFVGLGSAVEGRFMLSEMTVRRVDDRHDLKEQTANFATGDGAPRPFVRYEYQRR